MANTKSLVCVTEQQYVLIFSTRLWSVRISLISDTWNSEISGYQLCKRIN